MAAQILLSCRQRKIAGRISRERRELALPLSKRLLVSLEEPQGLFKLLMAPFSLDQEADQRLQVVSIPPYRMEEIHILSRWHRTRKILDSVIIRLDKTLELQQKLTRITWVWMDHSLMHSYEAKSCLTVGRIKYIIRELDQHRKITHQTILPRTIIRWEEALMDISTTIKDNSIKL